MSCSGNNCLVRVQVLTAGSVRLIQSFLIQQSRSAGLLSLPTPPNLLGSEKQPKAKHLFCKCTLEYFTTHMHIAL